MVLTKKLDALEEFRLQREQLMAKFDDVKTSGNMMPTATLAMGTMEGRNNFLLLDIGYYFCFPIC